MSQTLSVYQSNPRYFALNGRPVFLVGATPTWTPISSAGCDFKSENRALAEYRGNFTRILTFFPRVGEVFPWGRAQTEQKTVEGAPLFDLTTWNESYWRRWHDYFKDCQDQGIVVTLEIFDEPSIRYNKGPRKRWAAHPFNPDNNINLTQEDGLPAGVYDPTVRQFYDAVRLPEMRRVLELQERFVRKILEETLPFCGSVIYSICNEYSYNEGSPDAADKRYAFAFPKYWADFIHAWGREHGRALLVSMMPGRSPEPNTYFDDQEFKKYLSDSAFDAVDIAQNLTPADAWTDSFDGYYAQTGAQAAESFKRYYGRWTAYQEYTCNVKPLYSSKILIHRVTSQTPPSPEPVWSLFFVGAAASRCHRPGVDGDIGGQRRIVANLSRFVAQVPFWEMRPRHELVSEGCQCLADEGKTYAIFIPRGGEFRVYIPVGKTFDVLWCKVNSGDFTRGKPVQGRNHGVSLQPPLEGPAAALLQVSGDLARGQ